MANFFMKKVAMRLNQYGYSLVGLDKNFEIKVVSFSAPITIKTYEENFVWSSESTIFADIYQHNQFIGNGAIKISTMEFVNWEPNVNKKIKNSYDMREELIDCCRSEVGLRAHYET